MRSLWFSWLHSYYIYICLLLLLLQQMAWSIHLDLMESKVNLFQNQFYHNKTNYTVIALLISFFFFFLKRSTVNLKECLMFSGNQGPRGPAGPRGPPGPPGSPATNRLIAFSVKLGNNFPKTGVPIAFRQVIYNEQNSYDIETGYFTCPYAGVYEFDFQCTISQTSGVVDLMRNGDRLVHSYTTWQNGYISASGHIYTKLSKGDRVYLVTEAKHNGLMESSYFSGRLLYEE